MFPLVAILFGVILSGLPVVYISSHIPHKREALVEDIEREIQEETELDNAKQETFYETYGYPLNS